MLRGMFLHVEVPVRPVERDMHRITHRKRGFVHDMENFMFLRFLRVQEFRIPDLAAVAGLPSSFGIADGPIQNDLVSSDGKHSRVQFL